MQVVELKGQRRFSKEKFQKINIFDSPRMFCDIYCFEPGQEQKLHAHDEADKIYCVLEGRGEFTVGAESRELGPGYALLCPPGEEHGVVNAAEERLVVLVFMAPHP
jgi:quercetin dioxygenase-like cupin family protein